MVAPQDSVLKASWVNVISKVLKIVVEETLGILSRSIALTANAAHSVTNLLASAVVLIWDRFVSEDADESDPYGHDRFEPLTAFFIGSVLVLLGLKLLYVSSSSMICVEPVIASSISRYVGAPT